MATDYSVWSVVLSMALLSAGVGCGAYGALVPSSSPMTVRPFLLAFSVGSISLVAYELASLIYSDQALADKRKELGDIKHVDACPDFWKETADCNGKLKCIPEFRQTEGEACNVRFDGNETMVKAFLEGENGAQPCAGNKKYPWVNLTQRCDVKNRAL